MPETYIRHNYVKPRICVGPETGVNAGAHKVVLLLSTDMPGEMFLAEHEDPGEALRKAAARLHKIAVRMEILSQMATPDILAEDVQIGCSMQKVRGKKDKSGNVFFAKVKIG